MLKLTYYITKITILDFTNFVNNDFFTGFFFFFVIYILVYLITTHYIIICIIYKKIHTRASLSDFKRVLLYHRRIRVPIEWICIISET